VSPRVGIDLPMILRASEEIADAEGLESLTLSSLAHKLNVRPPSLYNHVNGLGDLRSRLAVHGGQLLIRDLTQAAVGRSGDDAVRAMAESYLAFARAHPGLHEAVQRVPDPQNQDWQQVGENLVHLVMQVFRFYGLEGEAAIHAVRGFRSMIHGFSALERSGGFGMPIDIHVSYEFLIDTFLAGIRVTPGSPYYLKPTTKILL